MEKDSGIVVTHVSGGCKYHRNQGERYRLEDITPAGLCPHAYFTAYPYILGMLHEVRFDWMKDDSDHVFAQCPALKSPRVLEVFRERDADGKARVFVRVGEKNDAVDLPGATACDCPHTEGDTAEANQGDGLGFCPAAFNQIYPFLQMYLKVGQTPFQGQLDAFYGVCPDNNNNVTFKISAEKD